MPSSAMTFSTASARNGFTTTVSCFISEPPAGHGQDLPCDISALLTGQEEDCVGHVLRLAEPAQRYLLEILGHHLGANFADHRGLNPSRGDGIRRDAALREFLRQHLGQRDDAGLGGGVVALSVEWKQSRNRRHTNDAPAVAQYLDAVFAAMEDAVEIRLNDAAPVVESHLADGPIAQNTGVVDENVQPAASVLDLTHQSFNLARFAHVGAENVNRRAGPLQLLVKRERITLVGAVRVVPELQNAGGASFREALEDGRADAARTAGDQGHPAGETVLDHRGLLDGRRGCPASARTARIVRNAPGGCHCPMRCASLITATFT